MKLDFCVACGTKDNIQYHHLIPRSLGGSDCDYNIISLCGECHGKMHSTKEISGKALTKAALVAKKKRGERTGSIPYGYDLATNGKNLIKNTKEQQVITEVKKLRKAEMTLTGIARNLAERGFKARSGKMFHPTQIMRLINTIIK